MFELLCEYDERLSAPLGEYVVTISDINFCKLFHGERDYVIPLFKINEIKRIKKGDNQLMLLKLSMLIGKTRDGWDFMLENSGHADYSSGMAIYKIKSDRRKRNVFTAD